MKAHKNIEFNAAFDLIHENSIKRQQSKEDIFKFEFHSLIVKK